MSNDGKSPEGGGTMKKILVESCKECPAGQLWCKKAQPEGISPDCPLPDEDEMLVTSFPITEFMGES